MSNVLIFFVLPVVTIILAIVLQKILKCPILVAATFFAIFLILAFTVFGTEFLIFAILLAILAFIVASITRLICRIKRKIRECCDCDCGCDDCDSDDCDCDCGRNSDCERRCDFNDWVCDILGRSRSRCNCRRRSDNRDNCRRRNNVSALNEIATLSENINSLNSILTTRMNSSNDCNNLLAVNSNSNCNNNSNCGCNCNNNDNDNQNVILNAEFTPNSNNNGTTGSFRGCYRRRFF